jgi:hypothetical protein
MPPVSTDTITVVCPCGKKLKAPASAAGKKAKCPACGNVMKLEASAGAPAVPPVPQAAGATTARKAAAPPPPPPPADHSDDAGADLDGLYELAAAEKQARATGAVDDSPRCPKCFSEMPSGAVLCTNCGFDLRSRKQITVQTGNPNTKTKPKAGGLFGGGQGGSKPGKKDKMAPQGSFLIGVACCAGFAAAGAVVWFLIGWLTGYSIGFVAMGVGALAGVGMQIGQKGYSKLGGVVAAALTLVAIIVANIAIAVVILAHPPGQTKQEAKLEEQVAKVDAELEKYDERVVMRFEEEQSKAQRTAGKSSASDDSGDGDSEESDSKYMRRELAEKQAALDKIKAMPKADYDAMIAKLDEDEERQQLTSHLIEEELTRRNVSIHQSSYEDHYNAAHEIAKKQVDGMTRDQVKAQLGPRQAKAEQEQKQRLDDFKKDLKSKGFDEEGGSSAAVKTGVFLIIILLIFGWKTIWFVLLAMFFAYRTASGGVSG